MHKPATWKDLFEFIKDKVEKEGEEFLENKIFIECQDPNHINQSFETRKDSEVWVYSEPAWVTSPSGKKWINSTTFKDEKIVTLNINY